MTVCITTSTTSRAPRCRQLSSSGILHGLYPTTARKRRRKKCLTRRWAEKTRGPDDGSNECVRASRVIKRPSDNHTFEALLAFHHDTSVISLRF